MRPHYPKVFGIYLMRYLEPYGASLNISMPRVVCYKFRGRVGGPLHLGSHSELGLCHLNPPTPHPPHPTPKPHIFFCPLGLKTEIPNNVRILCQVSDATALVQNHVKLEDCRWMGVTATDFERDVPIVPIGQHRS